MRRTKIVEIEVDDGEVIHAEVSVPATGDAGGVFDRLKGSELGGDIGRISRWLVSELRDAMPEQPSKTGLEFSIKIAVKTGRVLGVLAEVGADAAVVVKLEWTNPRPGGMGETP